MRGIFLGVFILLQLFKFAQAQTEKEHICLRFDYDADTIIVNVDTFNTKYNCIEINGVFSSQALSDIFNNISQKEYIEKISISNYADTYLPASLIKFHNLKQITVTGCSQINYNKLFRQLTRLPHLSVLELDDNEGANVPSSIRHLKNLNTFSIKNYEFVDATNLFKNLCHLPYLKHLTLSSTGKILLDKKCNFPQNLSYLDISDNWLSFVPQNISKNQKLETLNISENDFKDALGIISIIRLLPLKSLTVSCYDIIDSLSYLKAFPYSELHLSVYRNFQNEAAYKNKISTQATLPFIESYYNKTLKPVISNPEINRKNFPINSQKSNKLTYYTGTTITIPENAFIDSEGTPVNGDITVFYREFTDMADILTNGIALQYDSAGQFFNFQTAGMFEIFAAKGEQEVFLAPDKNISVDFRTLDTASGYNLYLLDNETNNWSFNTPLVNDVRFQETNTNPAYRLYDNLLRKDLSFFDDRYLDTAYARTTLIPSDYYSGKRKFAFSYFRLKRASKYIKNKDVKKMPTFYFDNLNYGIYKEMTAYRSFVWVYDGPLNKKEFAKTYISRKKWTDIRISYLPDDNIFEVELKSPHGFVSFDAFPVRSHMTLDVEKYEKLYLKTDKRYNKQLNKLKAKFDKKINKTQAQKQKDTWEQIYKLMTPEEKEMSKEDWLAYAQFCLRLDRDSINQMAGTAFRTLQINGFGIWNVDKIYKMKTRLDFVAQFKDAFDNPIHPSTIYAVDISDKTVIPFPAGQETAISINSRSATAFFMFCYNGSVAIVDQYNVKNATNSVKNGQNVSFTATEYDPTLLTTGNLRDLLGL